MTCDGPLLTRQRVDWSQHLSLHPYGVLGRY